MLHERSEPVINKTDKDASKERSGRRSRHTLRQKLAGAGLAVVATLSVGACNDSEVIASNTNTPPSVSATENPSEVSPDPTTPSPSETSPNPSETEAPQESFSEFIDSFSIEAGDHTTAESIVTEYVENEAKWQNAGLTAQPDISYISVDSDVVVSEVTSRFSSDGAPDSLITSQLFTDSAEAASARDRIQKVRDAAILEYWISINRGDEVPFEAFNELLKSEVVLGSVEAGMFVVNADIHATDNGNLNVGPNRIANGQPAQTDMILHSQLVFILNSETGTWEVDRITEYAETENNSK